MNRLPVEVLLCIFRLLHPVQKRECLLVCRRWQHVIQANCLWDTVLMHGTDAIKNIQGDQTQRLLVEAQNAVDLNSLSLQFPHLHFLYFFEQDGSNSEYANIDAENFKSWQNRLESIIGYSILHHVLSTGTYHRLTNITLKDSPRYIEPPYTNKRIFESFQNIPALSILRLENFDFEFEDYESLHKYTPSLTSLTLHATTLKHAPIPDIVSPVSKLTHLQIDNVYLSGYHMQTSYIRYIVQKYANLQHFSLSVVGEGPERTMEPEEYLFIECVEPLIQGLGNQITTLGIEGIPIPPQLFSLLDEHNYHLRHAQFSAGDVNLFIEELNFSSQIHSLTTLTLNWRFASKLVSFKQLVHLKSLKLNYILSYSENEELEFGIAFNHLIIELCPDNLKSLELCNIKLRMDPTLLLSDRSLPLQSLKLESVEIIQDISKCLSTCCPQLKEIYIGNSRTHEIILDLPDLDISLFETSHPINRKTYLLTDIDNEVYAYDGKNRVSLIRQYLKTSYGNHNLSVYPAFKVGLSNSNEKRTIINLTCRSLSTLFIDGRVVFQDS